LPSCHWRHHTDHTTARDVWHVLEVANSIKHETCIILKNADHVLWILGVQHARNGVQAGILELLQEGSLEDRQITAAVK
jgi:hypothetical protein